jgi:hypothetical protein
MEENYLVQVVFAFLGGCFFVWGVLIVGSDQFFEFWSDRYWREKNNRHKLKDHLFYNRYVTGLCTLLLGLGMVWIAFSKL